MLYKGSGVAPERPERANPSLSQKTESLNMKQPTVTMAWNQDYGFVLPIILLLKPSRPAALASRMII